MYDGNLMGAALPRWHIPALDPDAELPIAPPPPAPAAVAAPATPAAAVEEELRAQQERRALEEAVERAISAGRADGVIRGHAEGKEKGYAEGFTAGLDAAQQSQAQQLQRLAGLIDRLSAPIPALDRAIEERLVALALEVARCVIGGEISRSPEHLVRLIREALAQAPLPMEGIQIALNPADLEFVRTAAPEIERGAAVLVADPSVEAGGALIAITDDRPTRDRRWHPRSGTAGSQIDLSLAGRWRQAMLSLFDGEGK